MRRYRAWLETRGVRPTTLNAVLTALDHFYRHLRLGPAAIGRQEVPAAVRRALPPDQRQSLLRAADQQADPRDRAIAYTLLFTGVRVAELVALDLADLRLAAADSRLLVRAPAATVGREVPLHRRSLPTLREWRAARRRWSPLVDPTALFLNRQGGRLSTRSVGELVARLGELAGLTGTRLTPQTLRHTFGASLLDAGADLALVAVLMGHKRLDTTRRLAEEVSGIRSRKPKRRRYGHSSEHIDDVAPGG